MIDALSLAKQHIDKLKIPLHTISELTGISVTELSGMFTGQRRGSNDKVLKISSAVRALVAVVHASFPLPIDVRQSAVLREALDRIQSGDLAILAADKEMIESLPHAIRFTNSGLYFAGRDEGNRIHCGLPADAKSMPLAVAREVHKRLLAAGCDDATILVCKFRMNANDITAAWGIEWEHLPTEEADAPQGNLPWAS